MPTPCFIGVGSNLGSGIDNLNAAARALQAHAAATSLRASPVFLTPALLPDNAPADWNRPYHNGVIALEWSDTPQALLRTLQNIERQLGRERGLRWAPRVMDLDILLFGGQKIASDDLQVPHPQLRSRSFALDPLMHLAADIDLDGQTVLQRARALPGHAPVWFGILNLTPDSFSDGGQLADSAAWQDKIAAYEAAGVQIFDLGAESTRPGATPVGEEEEWRRLQPVLAWLEQRYGDTLFRPRISIDTRRADIARRALRQGATIINDVSGLADPAMLPLLAESDCDYVLMHSLTVPADKNVTLPDGADPVKAVREWAEEKLALLVKNGVACNRVIFDPGIGFGKTASQSLALLQRCGAFHDLPVRLLIGHSRKSFMARWGRQMPSERDDASIGLSLRLAAGGVDMLRVHEAQRHCAAWKAFQLC